MVKRVGLFHIVPYDFLTASQLIAEGTYSITLSDSESETCGVNSVTIDSRMEQRFTSYKYLKEGRDPMTGKGGVKHDYRQIRPKARERETIDMQVQGWFIGDNACDDMAHLEYLTKRPNTACIIVTDDFKFYSGAHGFYPTLINDCESTANWDAGLYPGLGSGVTLAELPWGHVEGYGAIRYWINTPSGGSTYAIRYNPASTFAMTSDYYHFWMLSSSAHDDNWSQVRFVVVDNVATEGYWNLGGSAVSGLQTFHDLTWTEIVLEKADMTGSPNLANIDYIDWRFSQKAGNSTSFYVHIDYVETFDDTDRKREIPFWALESIQSRKLGGVQTNKYEYTLKLKRIRKPPKK